MTDDKETMEIVAVGIIDHMGAIELVPDDCSMPPEMARDLLSQLRKGFEGSVGRAARFKITISAEVSAIE